MALGRKEPFNNDYVYLVSYNYFVRLESGLWEGRGSKRLKVLMIEAIINILHINHLGSG